MVTINNIKMTKEEARILDGFKVHDKHNVIIKNPYSGVEVELSPEAVAIYDIILGCERSFVWAVNKKSLELNMQREELFYTARDVFRRNWPTEYMILID